ERLLLGSLPHHQMQHDRNGDQNAAEQQRNVNKRHWASLWRTDRTDGEPPSKAIAIAAAANAWRAKQIIAVVAAASLHDSRPIFSAAGRPIISCSEAPRREASGF